VKIDKISHISAQTINNLLKFIITPWHLFSDDVTANTASAHVWCSDGQIGHFV